MMRFDILTIFPSIFDSYLEQGILKRAIEEGIIQIKTYDIRRHGMGSHRMVDDAPYGGGEGMVMRPEPIIGAIEEAGRDVEDDLNKEGNIEPYVILLSPRGRLLKHKVARELSDKEHLIIICGRYEGVDERLRFYVDDEISIGDYVLSGGELPAMVLLEAVSRFVPHVIGNDASLLEESHAEGLLEYAQYTRPRMFRGYKVPDIVISGDHGRIRRWRRLSSLIRTLERRPDLMERARISEEDKFLIREWMDNVIEGEIIPPNPPFSKGGNNSP